MQRVSRRDRCGSGQRVLLRAGELNDPSLLAQNGLAPPEVRPQFHQQMVYAVSRLTIDNFEHALGRKTLWHPVRDPKRGPKDDSVYVPQLRIYPHALREANAYYSPEKVTLLFGYFNANDDNTGEQLPGGTVLTCLSQDIVAHETTHALHRKFVNATNPDVLAFHEGFADVVALLQPVTFPEILRDQIANTRGDFQSHQSLLGQLAGQFGHATGLRGALREAIGQWQGDKWVRPVPNPADYTATTEPHARDAILVAAIFDAFLAIYEKRTADLLRIAMSGTGISPLAPFILIWWSVFRERPQRQRVTSSPCVFARWTTVRLSTLLSANIFAPSSPPTATWSKMIA